MENNDRLLPLGTIVYLREGSAKMVIIGRGNLIGEEGDKPMLFDYTGVPYPVGFVGTEQIFYFNAEHVDEVFFEGFTDKDDERASKMIAEWKVSNVGNYEIGKVDSVLEG